MFVDRYNKLYGALAGLIAALAAHFTDLAEMAQWLNAYEAEMVAVIAAAGTFYAPKNNDQSNPSSES